MGQSTKESLAMAYTKVRVSLQLQMKGFMKGSLKMAK